MPKMRYTAKDLLRGTMIEEPGWYPLHVDSIKEDEAKSDSSQNVIVENVIEDGKYRGVPVLRWFNEKAAGFIKDFAEACDINLDDEGGEFEFQMTVGKHIDGFIEQRKDDKGNLQNTITKFRKRVVEVA
jgi:hypothetical protein